MSKADASRPPNRLIHESSPYLRQHAHNPVDWYPWGEEALARARAEDKPILLSIGYAACHWCHVMAHESFEDDATAAVMNQHFINVKVDREERPDLDEVYMTAVQLLTHHGGWPMTVFLTPDGEPFYGGTYFPPTARHGLPSFQDVLHAVAEAYSGRKDELLEHAKALVEEVRKQGFGGLGDDTAKTLRVEPALDAGALDQAYRDIARGFDSRHGGFGGAPKFPSTMALSFCLRRWRATGDEQGLAVVRVSLEKMAAGGIHDHLGGGFHRYSVDERWLVPHFEKMLYDSALLARLYLEAWQATGDPAMRDVAQGIFTWLRREMTLPGGGFYSTLDADSEGVEGKYYVWTEDEVTALLGPDEGALLASAYDVTKAGNFEHGQSILHLPRPLAETARMLGLELDVVARRLEAAREVLLRERDKRVRPGLDDKVLASWNGLMLSTLAYGARVLGDAELLKLAVDSGDFLWRELHKAGRLLHTYKDGVAKLEAYLDDVAALGLAAIELHQATFDPRWIERASALATLLLDEFEDKDGGGFYFTGARAERLIARTKNPHDNAVPGGNSLAVHLLIRLHALTAEDRYLAAAERTLRTFAAPMRRVPQAFPHLFEALDALEEGMTQVVVAGAPEDPATRALVAAAFAGYHPNRLVAVAVPGVTPTPALAALVEGKAPVDGRPAAYVCRRFTCGRPALSPDDLALALRSGPSPRL